MRKRFKRIDGTELEVKVTEVTKEIMNPVRIEEEDNTQPKYKTWEEYEREHEIATKSMPSNRQL